MGLLTQNSKLKKTSEITGKKTFNFSLPAIITCPFAGECKKYCYANKGAFTWSNVKSKHVQNFKATKEDDFSLNIILEIIEKEIEVLRIHDTGDFYNREYLNKWITVIEALPYIKFYAYTKSIPLFKNLKLPDNFIVIYSYGGIKDDLIDVNNDRHAKVFEAGHMPDTYVYTNDNDHLALGKNKRIGLIKH